MADEKILYEGRIPWSAFHFSHGPLWLIVLGWNVGLLSSILKSMAWRIRITSQRVALTYGLISQNHEEVEFYRIRDTQFQQGVIGRLCGVGSITLLSDDSSAPDLTFPMTRPKQYREQIREGVRAERQRMKAVQVD